MFRWFVGIDLGTSGLRVAVLGSEGETRLQLRRSWPDGLTEEPETWWACVRELLQQVATQLEYAPAAIAVDGTSGTLLTLDPAGRPLGRPLMYDDARAHHQATKLGAIAPRTSAAHGATASAAKLLWLRDQGNLARAAKVLHQAEWITARLRGNFTCGDENNALKLGYDPVAGRWPQWWLDELGDHAALLPEIAPAGTPLGAIDPRVAQETGLHPDTRICAGTTDSIAGFLATGVADTHTGVTSLGSTLVLKQLNDTPIADPRFGVYSHRVLGQWLAGGASNSGGAVLAGEFSPERLAELSRGIDPTRGAGLDYYPLTKPGERFPVSDPNLRPRITPRPDDDARYLQGLLEGIAAIEAAGYQRLAELGATPVTRIVTVGGGARNATWTAIRSRLCRVPVVAAQHEEAARGAALLARHQSSTTGPGTH